MSAKEEQDPLFSPATPDQINVLAEAVATKLVVHHDVVMLDENGAMVKSQDRENRPRKKAMIETNETQISRSSPRPD